MGEGLEFGKIWKLEKILARKVTEWTYDTIIRYI